MKMEDSWPGSPMSGDGPTYYGPPFFNPSYGPPWLGYYNWPPVSRGGGGYPVSGGAAGGGLSRAAILTPVVIATAALIGSAVLLVTYYRFFAQYCIAWQIRWGMRRRGPGGGGSGAAGGGGDGEEFLLDGGGAVRGHRGGLDDSIVRKIPVYHFRTGEGVVGNCHECAVCLGEFENDDQLRLLPKCGHAFHLACIDVWLASHSNCPLCRAPIIAPAPQIMFIVEGDNLNPPSPVHQGDRHEQEEGNLNLNLNSDAQEQENEMVISIPGTDQPADQIQEDRPRRQFRRSLSLQLTDDNRHNRDRFSLQRCRSLQHGYSPSGFESVLTTDNRSQQQQQPQQEGFVVVNIEVGSSSSSAASSSSSNEDKPDEVPIIRKSTSLKESLGRVFSFRGFGRSKSSMQT